MTEWEVRAALGPYPVKEVDREQSICWSHRHFTDEMILDKNFDDTIDNPSKTQSLAELKKYMLGEFPSTTIMSYNNSLTSSIYSDVEDNTSKHEYIKQFKEYCSMTLHASLQSIIDKKNDWLENGCGMGLSGRSLEEILHHSQWAYEKCVTFQGREKIIESAIELINRPHRDPAFEDKFDCICMYLLGVSGSGKTALMAKISSEVFKRRTDANVIIRFCGTSRGSVNSRSICVSVCEQMEFLFKLTPQALSLAEMPIEDLVTYFHTLLHEYPVILFIDGLDQLTDEG